MELLQAAGWIHYNCSVVSARHIHLNRILGFARTLVFSFEARTNRLNFPPSSSASAACARAVRLAPAEIRFIALGFGTLNSPLNFLTGFSTCVIACTSE